MVLRFKALMIRTIPSGRAFSFGISMTSPSLTRSNALAKSKNHMKAGLLNSMDLGWQSGKI